MQTQIKFELIRNTVQHEKNLLSVGTMCRIAGVSRSGYYNWINSEKIRKEREKRDQADFAQILEAYRFRGYAKGARGIHMRLLHKEKLMNIKKIRRLMKKYGLKCPFRKLNPYRKMARDMKTDTVFPNVIKREFLKHGPRKVLLTDITYLFCKDSVCYLSTILDAFTREILAYEISENLKVEFVIETVNDLIARYHCTLDDTTVIHSDQGCHYTSLAFVQKLKSEGFIQSMSRKGNCWDNAPQESFFGHMKDEIKDTVKQCTVFHDVKDIVDDWIDYYNRDRYQWDLAKLSPKEYYQYATTGIYPLSKGKPEKTCLPDGTPDCPPLKC